MAVGRLGWLRTTLSRMQTSPDDVHGINRIQAIDRCTIFCDGAVISSTADFKKALTAVRKLNLDAPTSPAATETEADYAAKALDAANAGSAASVTPVLESTRADTAVAANTRALSTAQTPRAFVWLELREPETKLMEQVAAVFDLHELIFEDVMSNSSRPKVERYGDKLFFVIRTVSYDENSDHLATKEAIHTGLLQIVVAPDYIVAIRRGALPGLRALRAELDSLKPFDANVPLPPPSTSTIAPMVIAWRLAELAVDDYVRIAGELEEDVENLESNVFTPGVSFDIEQIYMLKREVLEMQHAVTPLASALNALTMYFHDFLSQPLRSYVRDLADNQAIAADEVASHNERLSALIDAAVALITVQQNNDMRKISALVGLCAGPTLIAGIYGMNFENMPELHTKYGYFCALAGMVLFVCILWINFRRNKWL